ncbi:HupE/UreJ family protein [Roseomonas elaeocarpi]|uniref:HupE/UreJ family protein n=1 Tax=Roseomonas elaeocarpi TaxID=907779 RepID=A0ABV6JMW4_9PROT
MRRYLLIVLLLPFLLPAMPALAHTGVTEVSGFTAGFWHPLSGADHLMAMVAIGLLAGLLGGRAVWALPAAFLGGMAAGGALGMAGVALPMVEVGIAASVIVLGAAVALALRLPLAAVAGAAVLFGLFHGHAHGAEMIEGAGAVTYAAGFLLATAALHALGVAVGRLQSGPARFLARGAGAAMAVAMLALLTSA